jgi:hypothetical protein
MQQRKPLMQTLHSVAADAAANASGINCRTAQRIVEAAAERRQRQFVVVC